MTDPVRIEADYIIETAFDPLRAAEVMAGEQSSGTFVAVPGETPELKERAGARVEQLDLLGEPGAPSLPGSGMPKDIASGWARARVTLSWPLDNIGASLPNLMSTVAGNLFELREFSGIRLLDIRLPSAFAERYQGPAFGVAGTRRLTGIENRPFIGTIIKPSVGLSAEETGALVGTLAEAGIDFVKDDELQSDGPGNRFEDRVRHVMYAVEKAADKHGHKTMVAFNLTGEIDEMRRRHDFVLSNGGTCVMASVNSVGLAGMIELGRHSALPIHGHRNGWGALTRDPMLGWSFAAWSKFWRLAGADHMHVNGLDNKFSESNESVVASARSLAEPMFENSPICALPVFSSGQTVHQAAATWKAVGSPDLIVTAGGGIMAHPMGVGAGVKALRAAWEAAMSDIPLEKHAEQIAELSALLPGGKG